MVFGGVSQGLVIKLGQLLLLMASHIVAAICLVSSFFCILFWFGVVQPQNDKHGLIVSLAPLCCAPETKS